MRIPSSFRLMGHTIKVKRIKPERWKHADCVAYYSEEHRIIAIRDTGKDTDTSHAYLHEVLHSCLSSMGHKLNHDESFVDNLAGLLHQAFDSAKYPEPRKPLRSRK